ncbi:MAG TPA: hypothetical protein VIO36_04270 [Anaerolineaceae bacterium]
MSDLAANTNLKVNKDEKVVPVMIYTSTSVVWGEMVVKEIVRVGTWLRTNTAPDDLCIFNGKVMVVSAGAPKAVSYSEIHVLVPNILAYHILPPAVEPLDYDVSEPNRKLEPMTAVVGSFRMDAKMRMATSADLRRYLEFTRETFTPLYEAEISNMVQPALAPMKVPYVMVRQATTLFATRSA